ARAHAQRMRIDQALADLDRAGRLAPALLPGILEAAEALRARFPEAYPCAILLADLYVASGRQAEAGRVLKALLDQGFGRNERLSILVRLWRLSSSAHDDEAARSYLEQAERLAPDHDQFLARVHTVHLAGLRSEAARLKDRAEGGARRAADLQMALRALVDLGDVAQAGDLLDAHARTIEPQEAARLRGEIALRRGDYARASEQLK